MNIIVKPGAALVVNNGHQHKQFECEPENIPGGGDNCECPEGPMPAKLIWEANRHYETDGMIYDKELKAWYICIETHTSGDDFSADAASGLWEVVPMAPTVNTVVTPDYANRESINRITTGNNGSWTVDRDGFVYCDAWFANTEDNHQLRVGFIVNDVAAIAISNHTLLQRLSATIPVKKGDIVKIQFANLSGTLSIMDWRTTCLFIPPRY